jgi:hypothetical protein
MGLVERWLPRGITCGVAGVLLSPGTGNSRPVPISDGALEERWDHDRDGKENTAVEMARLAGLPSQPICWPGRFGGNNMTRPGSVVAGVVAGAPHLRMLRMVIS